MATTDWARLWGKAIPADGLFPGRDPYVWWRVESQDTSANTSNVHIWVGSDPNGVGTMGTFSGQIRLFESNYDWYSFTMDVSAGTSEKDLGVWVVTHNPEGKRDLRIQLTGGVSGSASWQGTDFDKYVTLPQIPRASKITADKSTVELGGQIVFSMPRASSSFTHLLEYRVGSGAWKPLASGVGTSYTWTVPASLAADITTSDRATIEIACTTKNGSTTIGNWTSVKVTGIVPASLIPTLGSITVADTGKTKEATPRDIAAAVGGWVQGQSKARITASGAAGIQGSTITGYEVKIGPSDPVTSPTAVMEIPVPLAGNLTIEVRAIDSRGRKSDPKTTTITVMSYAPPTFSAQPQAQRCYQTGLPRGDGRYAAVTSKGTVSPLTVGAAVKNTLTRKVGYRKVGASAWIDATVSPAGPAAAWDDTGLATPPIIGDGNLLTTESYEIRFTLVDLFTDPSSPISQTVTVSASLTALSISQTGIAAGKVHERGVFEAAGDAYVDGDLHVAGMLFIDTDDWTLLPAPSGITSKAYYRRVGDKIELRGWFTHSSTFANFSLTTMATLPVGFRPATDVALVGAAGVNSVTPNYGGAINVYVSDSGVLSIENRFGTAAKWAHLDGCYFYI